MHLPDPDHAGMFHVVGIGGIGMSAIAEVMHTRGYRVQGSDLNDGANLERLRARGIPCQIGHDPANVEGAAYLVISSAVKPGNPEFEAARERGMPIIRRAEMLAELRRRLSNDEAAERAEVTEQLAQITGLRVKGLAEE